VGETEQELREKDKLIDSLAKEVSSLNATVSEGRQREASSSEAIQNYERRVARYREEL
jgi:molecular chaperone GrpE (heat shock protein)